MASTIEFLKPKNFPLSVNECTAVALAVMSVFMLYTIVVGATPLPLYGLALGISAWFIFYYPEVGLLISLVSTMWFERFFTLASVVINGVEYKLYPLDIVLTLTGISIVWQIYNNRLPAWRSLRRGTLDTAILIFGAACCVSLGLSLFKSLDHALAFGTFKNYFLYAIVYGYALILLDTPATWQRLINWLSVGGIGVLAFLAYGILSGSGLWTEYAPLSTSGTRLLAQSHAFFLFLFGSILTARFLWPNEAPPALRSPLVNYLWAAVAVGIVVSLQRHLWVCAVALMAVWLTALPTKLRDALARPLGRAVLAALAAATVSIGLIVLLSGHLPSQVANIGNIVRERTSIMLIVTQADSSARWRLAAWRAGLALWASQPIFGTGVGQEIFGYSQVYPFLVAARELHNDYLGILIQLGLFGLGALVYWFVLILRLLVRAWKQPSSQLFIWGSWILTFMAVFGVSIYWDTNFFIIWWWVALAGLRFTLTQPA